MNFRGYLRTAGEEQLSASDPTDYDSQGPQEGAEPQEEGTPGQGAGGSGAPCSYCGGTNFEPPEDNGKVQRAECEECGGTMVSHDGTYWQPDLIGQPDNHPSPNADPRSGGVGGIGAAPVKMREEDLSSRTARYEDHVTFQQYLPGDDEHTDLDSFHPGYAHAVLHAYGPQGDREDPIGRMEFSAGPDTVHVHETRVHQDYRRQGVATSLNDHLTRLFPHHEIDRGPATEDGEGFRRSLGGVDWCRHRHAEHCWLPRNDTSGQFALYQPQDRGVCPWTTASQQQINCPVSEAGPMAGMTRAAMVHTAGEHLLPVRHGGYKGFVEAYHGHHEEMEGMDREFSSNPGHTSFDEDLYDRVTPDPKSHEQRHYDEHGDMPSAYHERHDQAYHDAQEDHKNASAPIGHHTALINFIHGHGDNQDLWNHKAEVKDVDLKQPIHATQPYLVHRHLDRYINDPHDQVAHVHEHGPSVHADAYPGTHHPMFVRHEGNTFAIEGHHRTAAAMMRGDSHIKGFVYDADKHGFPENDDDYYQHEDMSSRLNKYSARMAVVECDFPHRDPKAAAGHALYNHDDGICAATERHRAGLRTQAVWSDPSWRFHVLATWNDVRAKAKRIRSTGGVVILSAEADGITGNVQGDTGIYESQINYVPGSFKIGYWHCGCAWASYAWGRSAPFRRFEGRMCFTPGMRVSMADGSHKPIEQVRPGDRVLTHDGVGTVRNLWENHYNGEIVGITRAGSSRKVWATADHGMLANTSMRKLTGSSSTKAYRERKAVRDKDAWARTQAGQLQVGDWLMGTYPDAVQAAPSVSLSALHEHVVVREGRGRLETPKAGSARIYAGASLPEFAYTDPFAVLLGYYLAEGSVEHLNVHGVPRIVAWTLGAHEESYAEEITGALEALGAGTAKIHRKQNRIIVKVSNATLALLLTRLVGTYAAKKELHPDLAQAPQEFQETLLRTYLNGDGCESRASTASKELARQLVALGCRIGHYVPREHTSTNNRGPNNRTPGNPIYYVETAGRYMQGRERLWENFYGSRVTGVERRQYHGPVYNLNVDDQHTYAVEDTVVFNCSHALALQYEAQSRGMFGRQVTEDTQRPGWMRDKVRVRHDRVTRDHDVREAARRTDPDGIYPQGHGLDLERAPLHAFVTEAYAARQDPADVMAVLLATGMKHADARAELQNLELLAAGLHLPVIAAKEPEKPDEPTHAGVVLKAADTGRILMIQRSHHDESDPAAGTWEFPGGGREDGDHNSLMSGVREFEEETGHKFPTGGHVQHVWQSPNGVYQGHVVVIPNEKMIDFSGGRRTVNPDDPDQDDHEQSAWWEPDHARKNPALRPECKQSPWDKIKTATLAVTADYASHDQLGDLQPDWRPKSPPKAPEPGQPENPGSTGWATGQDPPEWDNAAARSETMSLQFNSELHDEPEPALPMTTADEDDEGSRYRAQMSPEISSTEDMGPSDGRTASTGVAGIVERFQATAAAQALATGADPRRGDDQMDIASAAREHLAKSGGIQRTALKDFSATERHALITEGQGQTARNFPDLKIEGTHYEAIEAALSRETTLDPDDLFD